MPGAWAGCHWTFPAIPPPSHDLLTLSPASHHHSPYAKGHNQVPASVCSHSQEETWPLDTRGILWGISHCYNCHFINPDLVLAYLILAVKYWMTLILQVETPGTLGEMELGYNVPLQPILRKLWMGILGAGGGANSRPTDPRDFAFSSRRNLSLQ